jgi:hypothetical protein
MKNTLKLSLVLVQIILFISCKNAVTKTATPTAPQKVINTDTVAHQESHEIKWDTVKHQSNPFEINGVFLYWEKNFVMADERISELYLKLKYLKTKQLLFEIPLDLEDHTDNSDDFYNKMKKESFDDYNFDGFMDASYYLTGSKTSSTAIYLFNPNTKSFEYSEELSATFIDLDKKNRILVAEYIDVYSDFETTKKHHFDKNGKIKYTEVIKEYIDYKIYEKIMNGEVVKRDSIFIARE